MWIWLASCEAGIMPLLAGAAGRGLAAGFGLALAGGSKANDPGGTAAGTCGAAACLAGGGTGNVVAVVGVALEGAGGKGVAAGAACGGAAADAFIGGAGAKVKGFSTGIFAAGLSIEVVALAGTAVSGRLCTVTFCVNITCLGFFATATDAVSSGLGSGSAFSTHGLEGSSSHMSQDTSSSSSSSAPNLGISSSPPTPDTKDLIPSPKLELWKQAMSFCFLNGTSDLHIIHFTDPCSNPLFSLNIGFGCLPIIRCWGWSRELCWRRGSAVISRAWGVGLCQCCRGAGR